MVIVELSYKKSLDFIEKHLEEHRKFLVKNYKNNIFIASGPKVPRTGGIILARASKQDIEIIIKDDPFYVYGIADYRLISFEPNKYHEAFKAIVE